MKDIEIIPLMGIKLADKEIALSASPKDVEMLLGAPCAKHKKSLYYFNNELRLDFDNSEKIEFIEFLGGIDGALRPEIYGISAFEADADVLYRILSEKNGGTVLDNENGYSYAFLNISVGVFREDIPSNVYEMINEAEREGAPMSGDDIKSEMRRADHWATIGVGIKGYYD